MLLNLQNEYLFLEDIPLNYVSKNSATGEICSRIQKNFGKFSTQLAADRGFWSKENRQIAEACGIKKFAIENIGKNNYLKDQPLRE